MPVHSRKTILLAPDQQRSVLSALDEHPPRSIAYTPYGHRPRENGLLSLLGFNGELPDPLTGCYHLGNGYRQFNPVLMRFNSPDSWSPFGEGGLNAYGYCGGDPRNWKDPTGHVKNPFKGLLNMMGRQRSPLSDEIKRVPKSIKKIDDALALEQDRLSKLQNADRNLVADYMNELPSYGRSEYLPSYGATVEINTTPNPNYLDWVKAETQSNIKTLTHLKTEKLVYLEDLKYHKKHPEEGRLIERRNSLTQRDTIRNSM